MNAALDEALAQLGMAVGDAIGCSPWITVTQDDIDAFAEVTRDPDPMHVDPEWCAESGPFPTTIAFGFLTLSLITHMSHSAREWPADVYALNLGFDRVRFIAPVPVGSRIRGCFRLDDATLRDDGSVRTVTSVEVEIEGDVRLALAASWLGVFYPPAAQIKQVA